MLYHYFKNTGHIFTDRYTFQSYFYQFIQKNPLLKSLHSNPLTANCARLDTIGW